MRRLLCILRVLPVTLVLSTIGPWAYSAPICDQKAFLRRPIPLGVSGGNINNEGTAFCCSGTLGAAVKRTAGGTTTNYILSNNHALARTNLASAGELIIQPGLVDLMCLKNSGDGVAHLTSFGRISFVPGTSNTVGAAIAATIAGDVSNSILNVGKLAATIAPARLGQEVKKMGRTTCLTTSSVSAVNVSANVTYPPEQCNDGGGVALFTNQIMIGKAGFSGAGDSGSLIVTNGTGCPQAVGLLFAGSSNSTIANPIGNVLSALKVTIAGGCIAAKAVTEAELSQSSPGASQAVDTAALNNAIKVKQSHEAEILGLPGVVGIGVGLGDTAGQAAIEVYVEKATPEVTASIPSQLEGIPVRVKKRDASSPSSLVLC